MCTERYEHKMSGKTKIFIDGRAGTTGLRIYERLEMRDDISLIILNEEQRKDISARKRAICESDITFLCLPDGAAIQAVSLADNNSDTIIIDTSTAHRTSPGWEYGFPEISVMRCERIKKSKRIAVPGCHASGFTALTAPLVSAAIIPSDAHLCCFSLTGYSGGGKQMIAEYETSEKNPLLCAPRQYGITQEHKHLREMQIICGLKHKPVFCPTVADFYSGMEVTIPLFTDSIRGSMKDIEEIYSELYKGPVVKFIKNGDENGFLSAGAYSGMDSMEISVYGNEERIILTARYDNLGKGASGAAIECMNLVIGADPYKGLLLGEI